jgi:hypothetical protein
MKRDDAWPRGTRGWEDGTWDVPDSQKSGKARMQEKPAVKWNFVLNSSVPKKTQAASLSRSPTHEFGEAAGC